MIDVNGLYLHTWYNPFQDLDAFHCFDCDECGDCPFCGVAERYLLLGRGHQRYKSGFEVWKDWDDLKEVL